MRHVDILSDFPFTFFIEDINQVTHIFPFTSNLLFSTKILWHVYASMNL